MRGNMFIAVIDIDFALAVKDTDLFTDIEVGNTVIMLVFTQAYIVVL